MTMLQIPWIYVDQINERTLPAKNQPKTQKTFAQTLSNVCHISISQLPQSCEVTGTFLEREALTSL